MREPGRSSYSWPSSASLAMVDMITGMLDHSLGTYGTSPMPSCAGRPLIRLSLRALRVDAQAFYVAPGH